MRGSTEYHASHGGDLETTHCLQDFDGLARRVLLEYTFDDGDLALVGCIVDACAMTGGKGGGGSGECAGDGAGAGGVTNAHLADGDERATVGCGLCGEFDTN